MSSDGAVSGGPEPGFAIGQRPGRLLWAVNHVPTWIIRAGLGRLLGERLAMVVHRGRRTGQPRTVIVELADGSVAEGRLVFVAAYGERAQWIRNLRAAPPIRIVVNGRRYEAPRLEFLSPAQTVEAVDSYWRRYPHVAAFLAGRGLYPRPGFSPDEPGHRSGSPSTSEPATLSCPVLSAGPEFPRCPWRHRCACR